MQNILNLEQSVAALQREQIIAYPTETLYAIGGLALSPAASLSVFAAKGRPGSQPLPVIIGLIEQLPLLAVNISDAELELAGKFWPGPLSILFKAGPLVPPELLCGSPEVAIRQTPHQGAAALCRLAGPLSSSSANLSGESAACDPALLAPGLVSGLAGIAALPPRPVGGLPSTLVRVLEPGLLQVVRHGAIGVEQLSGAGWNIAD